MQYNQKDRGYNEFHSTGNTGSQTRIGDKFLAPTYQLPSKRQAGEIKRQTMIDSIKNDQLFQAFPQLTINRVDSAQHREKLKTQTSFGGASPFFNLSTSMIQKPTFHNDSKFTSTSVGKPIGTSFINSRLNNLSYNQETNKATYNPKYATYKKDNNPFSSNYIYGMNSQDGSQNEAPSYRRINNLMTIQRRMDMEISPKMVSSVISRGSSGKQLPKDRLNIRSYLSTNENNRSLNKEQDEVYDMYASRHPNQSIRQSTIQISKAISTNTITEMQRQNQNQQKKIKKLQKQLQQLKESVKKWDQIKHRYQLDIQSKSRQIFDLQRVNKRLTQQVQGIRAYRTMDTVEQVIIVRLKEQIMQLNKKIISMQADHYKNQKMFLEKQKSTGGVALSSSQSDETIRKLEQQVFINKKQNQLLGVQLKKQKQKSWSLQKQKQQYLAQKSIIKQNHDQQLNTSKKQITNLKNQLQKTLDNLKLKDVTLSQKLQQHKKILQKDLLQKLSKNKQQYRNQISQKLKQKQQQYHNKLNQQMRLFQSKIIQHGKNQKLHEQQQNQIINNLKKQKQLSQIRSKQIINKLQQDIRLVNIQLTRKEQKINNQFIQQIQNLKRILNNKQDYIRNVQNQNKNVNMGIQKRNREIDRLKAESIKILDDFSRQVKSKQMWKKQEAFIIQNTIKTRLQSEFKVKQKQLQAKSVNARNLEQNLKQMKIKIEQEKQEQASRVQAQIRQRQQKTIKDLQDTKAKLADDAKKAQINLANINKQLLALAARKTQAESQISSKQRQAKDIQQKFLQLQAKIQSKSTQLSLLQDHKKLLIAQNQKMKQNVQTQKVFNKQLETKYNQINSQLNNFKIEYAKLEQKSRQLEIQIGRLTDSNNAWKTKSQNLQSSTDKLKKDLAVVEKNRDEFKAKFMEAEVYKAKAQFIKKYEQLLPEYEIMKQKLIMKEQQIANRQATFLKAKQQVQTMESRTLALVKQMRSLTLKVTDTEEKLGFMLSRAQAEQHKYKQLTEKMAQDSQSYMAFIKKLQQDNQLIVQKYWKIRKLVKKQKINDDNDLLQKHDYTAFKQYLQKQFVSHFKKIIVPAFQAKVLQKISGCQLKILNKYKKLSIAKALVAQVKRKRQAQKSKLKAQ